MPSSSAGQSGGSVRLTRVIGCACSETTEPTDDCGDVSQLKKLAEVAKESQLNDIHGASWTLGGGRTGGREREVALLLRIEADEEGPERCGEEEEEEQENGEVAASDENDSPESLGKGGSAAEQGRGE